MARTQRAYSFIDKFMDDKEIKLPHIIDLMVEHYEGVQYRDKPEVLKQNLFVWFYDMKEGKIAKPNKEKIFVLCDILAKLEDILYDVKPDSFFIYCPISCRLHFTPFQPLDHESIEFQGVDWYFKMKDDYDFPLYYDFIYDEIKAEDIAIDVAELLEEPIEKWTDEVGTFELEKFHETFDKHNFLNSRKGKKAYLTILDWLALSKYTK